ncbi:MAG: xanthine/uracil/vitamin C permease [Planctomycetota bacterium]
MNDQGYPFLRRGDLNGFWALFADNLANMMIIATVCLGVFKMPETVVYGRILPGVGVALIVGLLFYVFQARRLARRENRGDVTALPYGISTPILFIYLYSVIGPVFWVTGNAVLAWQVGVAAAFLGGVLEMSGCLLGPLLKRITPRAGMLGTLAGIAIVWIATVPLAEIFEHAAVGFPALAIILLGLVAGVRFPGGIPAGLLAIVVGVTMGFVTGESELTSRGIGVYFPIVVLSDLWAGLKHIAGNLEILAIVLPIEIYNFIETMNNVESAEAAGDHYNVRTSQFMDGIGTMAGAICGSPFPTTVFIGHPAYKRLGAGCGYALLVGLVFFIGNTFGLVAFLHGIIPVAAVAPLLVFVGIVICAQAFTATPPRHAMAVAIAIVPHLSDILTNKMSNLARYLNSLMEPSIEATELGKTLEALSGDHVPHDLAEKLVADQGIHMMGQQFLSRGAILTGLIWGAMTALLIDNRFLGASAFALAGLVLALLGFIHSPRLGIHYDLPLVWSYGLIALLFAATHKFCRRELGP